MDTKKSIKKMRLEAAQKGATRFDPGRPCSYGHWAERYVVNGRCVECMREADRRYYAEVQAARNKSGVGKDG